MKKFNEFSISAFVATVPEVKEFEKSSVARFCLSVSHTENKGDEKVTKTALLPVEKWISNDKKDELKDLKGRAIRNNVVLRSVTYCSYLSVLQLILLVVGDPFLNRKECGLGRLLITLVLCVAH